MVLTIALRVKRITLTRAKDALCAVACRCGLGLMILSLITRTNQVSGITYSMIKSPQMWQKAHISIFGSSVTKDTTFGLSSTIYITIQFGARTALVTEYGLKMR